MVFTHNLVGGYALSQRGGAEVAYLFEWGGHELLGDDTNPIIGDYTFDQKRPGMCLLTLSPSASLVYWQLFGVCIQSV